MPDVTAGLAAAAPIPQRQLVSGYVSRSRPAPATFTDPLYVIAPGYSLDFALGPCKWAALHGRTLPAQGAQALVAFDDQGVPVVVWWDGATVF